MDIAHSQDRLAAKPPSGIHTTVYAEILFTNILRLLQDRGMTKQQLSEQSGVSISFLSDLTRGRANPSLETMANIARALEVGVPELLELQDVDRKLLDAADAAQFPGQLPPGFLRISAILPSVKAFVVRKWDMDTRFRLKQIQKQQSS